MNRTRRRLVAAGAGLGAFGWARMAMAANMSTPISDELAALITQYAGGVIVRAGKVNFDIAELVENGNTVPVTITVESPMSAAEHVKSIAIFNERNPQRDVARFALGPRAGRAVVTTRIRLATSQHLVAVAQLSDGSYWSHTVEVLVTLAACVET